MIPESVNSTSAAPSAADKFFLKLYILGSCIKMERQGFKFYAKAARQPGIGNRAGGYDDRCILMLRDQWPE